MNYKNYFKKNGFIYGVSEKFEFGRWTGYVTKFTNLAEAEKWVEACTYDWSERELCSKTTASRKASVLGCRLGYMLEENRDWSFVWKR